MSGDYQTANNQSWPHLETIYSMNLLANVFPEVLFDIEQSDIQAKYDYYRESFEQVKRELLSYGIEYKELKYALLPHGKDKMEIAFVFDANLIEVNHGHIYDTLKIILNTIGRGSKKSTYAILGGDIPYRHGTARALEKTLTRIIKNSISESDFFVIYFNNLSRKQLDDINANLVNYNHYLGYVFVNQDSLFKRVIAGCLQQICLISKDRAIIESDPEASNETNNPFCDLLKEYYDVAIVNEKNYGTFLAHAITSVFQDIKNVSLHVNAIYPQPINYSIDNIIITQEKIDYLKNDNDKHIKWSAIFGTTEYTSLHLRN